MWIILKCPRIRRECCVGSMGNFPYKYLSEASLNTFSTLSILRCHTDLTLDPSREYELQHKINVFRKLIVTDDGYPHRHVLVFDSR